MCLPLACTPPVPLCFLSLSFRAVYVSFGGLLMRLEADPRHFLDITLGSNIYLLMRKI